MLLNYLTPLFISLGFIFVIYLNKYICTKLNVKNEDNGVIIAVSIFTIIAMAITSVTSCKDQSFSQCFYLSFDFIAIMKVLIGNTILFSTYIITMSSYIFGKPFLFKALVVGPIVEEILFRAIYFSVSHQQPNIYYLSFIFSAAHVHHLINLLVTKQPYNLNSTIFQLVFTFIFGLYCFYILKLTRCIWAVILLHSYCNYLGPPVVQKSHIVLHLASIVSFIVYSYLVY